MKIENDLPPGGETSPVIPRITEAQREARMQAAMDAVRNGTAPKPAPRPTPDNPHPEEDDEEEERDDGEEDEEERDEDEEREDDDQEEEEGDDEEEKPAPSKPPAKKATRTVADVIKEKRKENKQLRNQLREVQQQVADLQKARPAAGVDESKLSEEAQSNPLGFIRRFKIDQGKLYDQLTQRQLAAKNIPEELQDQFMEQQRALQEMQEKLAKQEEQREQATQQAAMLDLGTRFLTEARDTTTYPELDGYEPLELLKGGNYVRDLALAKGIELTPKQIAQKLNEVMGKEHAKMAARGSKKKPQEEQERAPVVERPRLRKVAPTERAPRPGEGRSKGQRVREPTEKEVQRRIDRAVAKVRR